MVAIKKKVLLIRLDKIGDLICTLPADQILDSSAFDVTWVVQKDLGQLLNLSEKLDAISPRTKLFFGLV